MDDPGQVHRLALRFARSALESGEHEELADEEVQTLGLALDPVEGGLLLARPLAREAERDVQARERRAKLVRDVPE